MTVKHMRRYCFIAILRQTDMIVEEYKEPGAFDNDGDSWYVEPGSGAAFGVCGVAGSGQATSRCGGSPAYAPLAWGSCDAAEYGSVTGWVVVTDLDGDGGKDVPGRMLAAYWRGRIWLKLTTQTSAPPTGDAKDEPHGAVFLGRVGVDGLVTEASSRAVRPHVCLCPMGEREKWLKTENGRWRGDLRWEVLANYGYHPEKGDLVQLPEGSGDWWWKNAYRVTVWVVACGNVLCFYTTRSLYFTDDLKEAAPTADRLRWSAWGMPYVAGGGTSTSGGPFAPFWCALLPWEAEKSSPVQPVVQNGVMEALGPVGTENYLGRAGARPGLEATAAMSAPVSVCGRFHYGGLYGAGWLAVGWTEKVTVKEATGYDSWQVCVRGFLVDHSVENGHAETAQDYRFDPCSIEGQGVSLGYCAGWYTPGDEVWPAVAPRYAVLTEAQLESPYGPLYLAVAGSQANGVLLTASCFAEPPFQTTGSDDPPTSSGPSAEDSLPEVPGQGDESGDGPWAPGGPDGDGDEETDDEEGSETLADGYYYVGGAGCRVVAQRFLARDAQGKVVNITFDFLIAVTEPDLIWNATGRYRATVQLGTSNGGSYMYYDEPCTMFYGFSASSYEGVRATVLWKSSHKYSDTDPKQTTVRTYVTRGITAVARFPEDGYATSEAMAVSNILSFRKTGRRFFRAPGRVKRYFDVYTVTLKKGVLKGIALRKALAVVPQVTVQPGVAVGSNTGQPAGGPVVTASAGSVALAHTNDYSSYPVGVTGCMPAEFAADFEAGEAGVSVGGTGSWHYDDYKPADGEINASFKVSINEQSSEL